jgi:Icc-related predicted phosphoesterase
MKHKHAFLGTARLLAALVATAMLAGCRTGSIAGHAASADSAFYFVQITDTHIGVAGHDQVVTQIVEMINALPMPLACVVHTGDLSSDQLDRPSFTSPGLAALRRIKAPLHFVPGNHDIIAKRPIETLAAWTNAVGPLCSAAEHNGVVFIFVFVEPLVRQIQVPDYDPLARLEQELKAAGNKPVLVFLHTPPMDDFYRNESHAGWSDQTRQKWMKLMKAANVKAVIAGHFHRDELQWIGDLPVYVAPPAARFYGRQPSFRIYEYSNGRLSYRTCYLQEAKRTAE